MEFQIRLHGGDPTPPNAAGVPQEDGPGNAAWQRAQRLAARVLEQEAARRRN